MTFEEDLKRAITESNTPTDLEENILRVREKYCLDKQKVRDVIAKIRYSCPHSNIIGYDFYLLQKELEL